MKNFFFLDKIVIGASALCTLHCLLLPVLLVLTPVIASTPLGDEGFHLFLIYGITPLSVLALAMGCKKHGSWNVLSFGLIGLTLLVLTQLFGHDYLGEFGEKIATILGSVFIIIGHTRNYRLCRSEGC